MESMPQLNFYQSEVKNFVVMFPASLEQYKVVICHEYLPCVHLKEC